jgi:hypothetical protein
VRARLVVPGLARGARRLAPVIPVLALGGLLAFIPYPTCLVRLVLGVPCPACGLTRATLATARLDFASAVTFHPLSPALLALFAITAALAAFADEPTWKRAVPVITGAAGVALVIVWALRFAGFFGGPVPE